VFGTEFVQLSKHIGPQWLSSRFTQVICDRQKPLAHDVTVQLRLPSHWPRAPAPVGVHAFPTLAPHVPTSPGLVQESHGPLHCSLQQVPLTQKLPFMQSEPRLHGCPLFNFCATHFAPMQYGVVGAQFV
jgi:hypothetical protein